MKRVAIIIALLCLAATPAAHARTVHLNGVDISAVRNQTFKGATVTIDKNGNVLIDAPGYKVEVVDPPAASSSTTAPPKKNKGGPNPMLQKRYYLVTQPSPGGRAQYDFVISANGVEYKTIKAGSPQVIVEISAWLHKGENEVHVKCVKNLAGGRKSSATTDEARVLIGIGHEEGKTVKIDKIKAKVKVDASQLSKVDKHFVLLAE